MLKLMTLPLASNLGLHPEQPPRRQRRDPGTRQCKVCRYWEGILRSCSTTPERAIRKGDMQGLAVRQGYDTKPCALAHTIEEGRISI